MLALAVALAGAAAESGGTPTQIHMPYLPSPSQDLTGEPVPQAHNHPWEYKSNADLFGALDKMHRNADGTVDLEKQKKYQAEIDELKAYVSTEAAAVKANQDRQKALYIAEHGEAEWLVQARNNENSEAAVINAGVTMLNGLLLAQISMDTTLGAAVHLGEYVGHGESDVDSVISAGDTVIAAAQEEMDTMTHHSIGKADNLLKTCHDPQMEWNRRATTAVNEMSHRLNEVKFRYQRCARSFDRAHEKIVSFIVMLGNEQQEVSAEGSLLQERAKAVIGQPVQSLHGSSFAETGIWDKLAVLKDLFEARFGEELPSVDLIAKKFHDA